MRLVILLITIHIGYITSKAVYPNSCDDPPENDQRLKRNKDKELTKTEIIQEEEDEANYHKPNDDLNDKLVEDNPHVSKQFILTLNNPINTGNQRNIVSETININNINNHKQITTPYPVYYEKVDPKLIITSQLYNPNNSKRFDNDQEQSDVDVEETISIDLLDPNFNLSNITDERKPENLVTEVDENKPDVLNIRELREHLLDHLLDYFLNIIKDEQYNETIKRNAKDHMKVEDKLRNYYDPHHIDLFIDEDEESDYDDNVFDSPDYRRKNYKEKSKLENQFYVSSENETVTNENILEIIENNTEHNTQNNNNSQVNDAWSSDDLDFNNGSNTEALHDSMKLINDENVTDNDTASLENTETRFTDDDDDSDEEVFKSYTNKVTTTEASSTTIKTGFATVSTGFSTHYKDFEEKDSMEDDQIDEYIYNDEIDEYQHNKNDNDELTENNNEEENLYEDKEIDAIKNNDITNKTFSELDDTIYNDFNTALSNLNANKSIQFVVHLQNVDSSQLDGKEPVNTTQILTILKKIKHDHKRTVNNTKHIKNKTKSRSKRRHCKKNILLNLNINLV